MSINPMEIPEWIKTMNYLFGVKWGHRLGRTFILSLVATPIVTMLVLILANLKSINENLSSLVSPNNPLLTSIASLILLIVGFGGAFAILTLLAVVPAQFLRGLFDGGYRGRLDDTFTALLSLLQDANKTELNSDQLKLLLEDTQSRYEIWRRTKANILINWLLGLTWWNMRKNH
jgi:hypothetical protein